MSDFKSLNENSSLVTNFLTNISICILAHNESRTIRQTLYSLFKQSLFQESNSQNVIEIIVVPNGCTDDTAEITRTELNKLVAQCPNNNVKWQVCEVAKPGKSNAWNLFVHQFSDPNADFLIFMDADIEFIEKTTLQSLFETLKTKSEAWVALDSPVKHIAFKKNKTPLEKLSVLISRSSNSGPLYICGQLYCARASAIRKIWMPPGSPVEDGFLTGMVWNDDFSLPPNYERIIRVESAFHVFQAYTNPIHLLRHEIRIVVGIVINSFLFDYFQLKFNERDEASSWIKSMNEANASWLGGFIQTIVSKKGYWVIPLSLVFRRFRSLQYHHPLKALILAPVATIAFFVDSIVFFIANYKLRKGISMNFW
jgi:glycosyltransferase involved in cell wall biosynthesis